MSQQTRLRLRRGLPASLTLSVQSRVALRPHCLVLSVCPKESVSVNVQSSFNMTATSRDLPDTLQSVGERLGSGPHSLTESSV